MRASLPFGRGVLPLDVPDGTPVLHLPASRPPADPAAAVANALDHPLGAPALAELARGRGSACVVVSDVTRPVPNRLLLPAILERLAQGGVPDEGTEILIGTGTHRAATREEVSLLVGDDVAARYRVRSHDCRGTGCQALGRTAQGMPVAVDSGYLRADLRILTGLIEPHLMAGWSGGRKALCPGICSLETINAFHAADLVAHPLARPGVLEGNPIHQRAVEAARLAGVDFTLNVTLNERREVTGVFGGALEEAHLAGVRHARTECEVVVPPAEIVVTTSAGYPLDGTLYQAAKGLAAAQPVVRAGGVMVLVAACEEGLGSADFSRVLSDFTPDDFDRALRTPGFHLFEQWQAQAICRAARHCRLILVTSRNAELAAAVRQGWLETAADPQAALVRARALAAEGSILVMPPGPYLLATPACETG